MIEASPLAAEGAIAAAVAVGSSLFAATRIVGRAIDGGHAHSRARLGRITAGASVDAPIGTRVAMMRARRGPAVPALRAWITKAGVPWEPIDLLVLTLVTGALASLLVFAVARQPLAALAVAPVGAAAPWMLLHRKAASRGTRLNTQVVDMVELLASSLKSGFGVVQSLEMAAREQPEPMSGELRRVVREIHLGSNTEESLERFAQRAGDADLTLVVTAVLVQRRVGGDLAEVLLNLAGTIRDRIRVRGEVRALTAQARMSAWIVGMLPVALSGALFVLAPAHISLLFTDPTGRLMAMGAITLEVVGFWMVQRVSQIDY
ncbi:MAG: secretion system protein [Dehalococcoidia bacterium]|nr:MAG: secretion system protein [Dehalococcoidia bacterium]